MPYSFQGCGTKFYGKKAEALDGSYITTEWLTLLHFPLIPLGSFRVLPYHSPHTHFHLSPDEIGIKVTQEFLTTSIPLDGKQVLNIYLCDLAWIGALVCLIALLDVSPKLALIVAGAAIAIYVVKEAVDWIGIWQSKRVAKLCGENKFAAALPIAMRAERMARGLGQRTRSYMIPLDNLAFVYMQLGQFDKAEPLYRKSSEIHARSVGKKHADYVKSLLDLAQLYRRMGQPAKAEPLLCEAVAVTRAFGSTNSQFRSSLIERALVHEDLKQFDKAVQVWAEALSLTTEENPEYLHIVKLVGMDYAELQQFDKAQPFFEKTAEAEKLTHGDTSVEYAISVHNLAFAYSRVGQTDKAKELYRTALSIFGKKDPDRAARTEFELKQLDAIKTPEIGA